MHLADWLRFYNSDMLDEGRWVAVGLIDGSCMLIQEAKISSLGI